MFEAKLVQQEGVDFVPRKERLCDQGLGSELIEYDSVLNQMPIWCYMQGVGPENAVYKSLSSLAAEEMLNRARAIPKPRLPARLVVKPASVVKPVTPAGVVSKPAVTGGRRV